MKLVTVYEEGDKIGRDEIGITGAVEALDSLPTGSKIQDGSGDSFRKYPSGWKITDPEEDQTPMSNTQVGTYLHPLTVTGIGSEEVEYEYGIVYRDPEDPSSVAAEWGLAENPLSDIESNKGGYLINGKMVDVYRVFSRPLQRSTMLADYLVLAHG